MKNAKSTFILDCAILLHTETKEYVTNKIILCNLKCMRVPQSMRNHGLYPCDHQSGPTVTFSDVTNTSQCEDNGYACFQKRNESGYQIHMTASGGLE